MDNQDNHIVPGQATLPTLQDEMGFAAIKHLKPQHEVVVWEFVLNGGNGKLAYQKGYPGTKETSALANSCRLLKSERIQQRIAEVRAELQRRYAVDAQSVVRLLTMSMGVDRRLFIDEKGKPLDFHALPPEAAAITDIQIVMDRHGTKHAIPVVPERIKAAMELAKIMGITKEKIELTGPSGESLQNGYTVNFYIPENGREPIDKKLENLREKLAQFRKPGDTQTTATEEH